MATFSQQIQASGYDAFAYANTWYITDYNYIGAVSGGALPTDTYLLYTGVSIPNATTITSATLSVTASSTLSGSASCDIGVADLDNATMPTGFWDAASYSYTASKASWTVPDMTSGLSYTSPDFASSVQAVINRAGWASGNNLLVMVRNTGSTSYRMVKSYDRGSGGPTLTITYPDPGGQPITVRFGGTPGMRIGGPAFGRGW